MAYTVHTNALGAFHIHKFEDVAADFPSEGIVIPNLASIALTVGSDSVDLLVTNDPSEIIEAGNAQWALYSNYTDDAFVPFDPAPNGILLQNATAGAVQATIKVQ